MTTTRTRVVALAMIAASIGLAACNRGGPRRNEMRFVTEDFVIRVAAESLPVRSLEPIHWRVVVHERETGKPVQAGQGRIYATSRDRKTVANGLEATEELGTYRTNLMFVTAGMWAMAVQFRRDSTQKLQATADWTQDVLGANEPGTIETPISAPRPNPDSTRIADSLKKVDSIANAARKKKP